MRGGRAGSPRELGVTSRVYPVATHTSSDLRDPTLRNHFVARLGALDRERSSYLATWRDLAAHFAPRRGRFLANANDSQRGRRRDQRIVDNTPLLAARVMASGMMAGISSPARPWFRLRLGDDAINADAEVRAWLDEVQKRLLHAFAKSNLYNCLHTLYGELGVFGTAALWVDEDEEDIVRGYTLTAGEYDLLIAFVDHPRRVLNRDQLLDMARGRAAIPFDRSIDVQVGRLRRKIEPDPKNPVLIKTVRGGGYMFTPEVEAA